MSRFADAIAAVAAASPVIDSRIPPVPGRVLLIDGDSLAYSCAGNDECDPGQARINVVNRIEQAKRRSGAEEVRILMTANGSHKGHRYAIATVKDYQGNRSSGRRPKNWQYLRDYLLGLPNTEVSNNAEADDLFAKYAHNLLDAVLHYQDKDMRQIDDCWHLTWDDFQLIRVPKGAWSVVANGKQYGRKWFWLQMLHGDTADNIPGLPKYVNPKGSLALCGEVTAGKLLAMVESQAEAFDVVLELYRGYWGERAEVALLEQAILLWLRRIPGNVFDCMESGGPLAKLAHQGAVYEIESRVAKAQSYAET
jgi:DNA polymerase-1